MTTSTSSHHREITIQLLRKRSEHNDNILHNLEELALHQENLTAIGKSLQRICGKTLKILLLQNNVISSIGSDLRQCKSLEYLNFALNNLSTLSGMEGCESLTKLDLTLNFISMQNLRPSLEILSGLEHLRELYLVGNPCAEATKHQWKERYYRLYIISKLPQIERLDGNEIKRSDQIIALQDLDYMEWIITKLCDDEKNDEQYKKNSSSSGNTGLTEHTPEVRAELSYEQAQQLADKEANEQQNQPKFKGEKEFDGEQEDAVKLARAQDASINDDVVRMKNEGRWKFRFDEETEASCVLLHVDTQKHLSSSLIDVDIHPRHVTIVIKSKILRLRLPAEVIASKSKAERSSVTGRLLLRMPKVDPNENMIGIRAARRAANEIRKSKHSIDEEKPELGVNKAYVGGIGNAMLLEANGSSSDTTMKAVKINGLVEKKYGGIGEHKLSKTLLKEVYHATSNETLDDYDTFSPPPIF